MHKSELREWLSVGAVVNGLVFVGYEIRQNTKIQRITAPQTYQDHACFEKSIGRAAPDSG